MPIIQNYSDKNKLKANILTTTYTILALTIAFLLLKNAFTPGTPNEIVKKEDKKICLGNDIPETIVTELEENTKGDGEYKISSANTSSECTVVIGRNIEDPNEMRKLFDTTYILVQSNQEGNEELSEISQTQLINALITQQLGEHRIIWDQEADSFLKSAFNIGVGQIVYPSGEIERSLQEEEGVLAIIESTQRKDWMNVVSIDEHSPYSNNFNPTRYPLIDRYWIGGNSKEDIDKIYDILVK